MVNPIKQLGGSVSNIAKDFYQQVTPEKRTGSQISKEKCEAKGWIWDEATQTCNPPQTQTQQETKIPEAKLTQPESIKDEKGNVTGLVLPNGNSFTGLKPKDVNAVLGGYNQTPSEVTAQGIQPSGTAQNQLEQQIQAQQLSGQLGNFQQLGVSPTGLDVGEAATTGLVNAIPRALSYATAGLAAGAAGGAFVGGVGAVPGAIIGAVGGFISGIASSMISNFKSQRSDTTTAQQRVLDEGKQNLNDWATLAASDPANRATYVKNFNQQLALIDQAYRQMKLDTSRDVAKFETALPNLAEFEAFYSAQGERDFLVARMRQSLGVQQDPEYIYQLAELKDRYK